MHGSRDFLCPSSAGGRCSLLLCRASVQSTSAERVLSTASACWAVTADKKLTFKFELVPRSMRVLPPGCMGACHVCAVVTTPSPSPRRRDSARCASAQLHAQSNEEDETVADFLERRKRETVCSLSRTDSAASSQVSRTIQFVPATAAALSSALNFAASAPTLHFGYQGRYLKDITATVCLC